MSLSKSYSALQASASNGAGSTTNSSNLTVGYGASIIARVTNGATGPTAGCTVNLQVTTDGGTTWVTALSVLAGTAGGTTYAFLFTLGVGGESVGDWATARVQFTGNAAQAVTVQADASSTTSV